MGTSIASDPCMTQLQRLVPLCFGVALLCPSIAAHADDAKVGGFVKKSKKSERPFKRYYFQKASGHRFRDPHPISGGGWCRHSGWHLHDFAPVVNVHWGLEGTGWVYLGLAPEPPPVVVVESAPPPPQVVVVAARPASRAEPCELKEETKPDKYEYKLKCKGGQRVSPAPRYSGSRCKVKEEIKPDEYVFEMECKLRGDDD
jgi:hypothetical protein